MPLHSALDTYQVDFSHGITKNLGNSGVEVEMFEDEEGNHCGMLKLKNR